MKQCGSIRTPKCGKLFKTDTSSGHRRGLKGSTHRANPAQPQVADREGPLVGGCQVIIQKAWPYTIVGDVFGECHAPCT